jgi:hypothetical protein
MTDLLALHLAPDILQLAAVAGLSVFCYAAKAVGDHFRHATHMARVTMIAGAAVRVAGAIAGRLAAEPPPAHLLGAVKAAAIAEGVTYLRANLPATIAAVGVPESTLAGMIGGELGRMTGVHVTQVRPAAPPAAPPAGEAR